MNVPSNDTIAAIATPSGEGALSIIRISGQAATEVAERVFRGSMPLRESLGHRVHVGRIVDAGGQVIDEVLATVFRRPHSYTGEESIEFSCHGGMLVTQSVLDAVLEAGARQAAPGEFTRRAFLNGKMDLSQAEAVADLIAARSRRGQLASLEQLEGKLGGRVAELKSALTDLRALLEIDLDFSEEGIDLVERADVEKRIRAVDQSLHGMIDSFESGRVYREGVSVALVGRPNAGKSSLFNSLLQENRAIVTAFPGTTRDSLEESVSISGILFRLADTAGLREAADAVEAEGVKRSKEIIGRADVCVLVVDASPGDEAGNAFKEFLRDHLIENNQRIVVALNKSDLLSMSQERLEQERKVCDSFPVHLVSAKTGMGMAELKQSIVSVVAGDGIGPDHSLHLTNRRHRDACVRARTSLENTLVALAGGVTNEFLAFDLGEAVSALAEITGEVTTEDVLNGIFAKYCIGK